MIIDGEWLCECCGHNPHNSPIVWPSAGKPNNRLYYSWSKQKQKLTSYANKPNRDRYCDICIYTTLYRKARHGIAVKYTFHKRPCNPNVTLLKLMSRAVNNGN